MWIQLIWVALDDAYQQQLALLPKYAPRENAIHFGKSPVGTSRMYPGSLVMFFFEWIQLDMLVYA